jgi:hypothetical protein
MESTPLRLRKRSVSKFRCAEIFHQKEITAGPSMVVVRALVERFGKRDLIESVPS